MSEDINWDTWFNNQYDLNSRIEKAIKDLSKGDNKYQIALWTSVIEKAAEEVRSLL